MPTVNVRERDEMIYKSTVLYWWQKRVFILAVLAGLAVLYAIILLLIPAKYKAEASVIIMPPRYAPEVRTSPLTVPTAQAILETKELYQQVLTRLRRDKQLISKAVGSEVADIETARKLDGISAAQLMVATGASEEEAARIKEFDSGDVLGLLEFEDDELAELNVDAVGEMLSSDESIDKKTASDLIYSPVIKLFAVADTGNKAQVLANTWASLFEKKYELITRGQTQRLNTSLENQQNSGRVELEKVQKELVDFRLSHNLTLLERQIRDYTDLVSTFTQQLSGRQHEHRVLSQKVATLSESLKGLEDEGRGWIGNVDFESELPAESADVVSSVSSLLLSQTMQSRTIYTNAMKDLRELASTTPVEYLSSQEKEFRNQLVVEKREIREGSVRIKALEDAIHETDEDLNATTGILTLTSALPDEVLGNAVVAGDSRKNLSAQFQREQINPLWESLIKTRSDLRKDLASEKGRLEEYQGNMTEHETELKGLIAQVTAVNQEEMSLKQRVERAEKLNAQMFQVYLGAKSQLVESSVRVEQLGLEIKSMEETIRLLNEKLDSRREEYETATSQEVLIQLRIKAVESQAQVLTQKLQEAVVAVGEQVSDVSIASRAVAPARHFFPPRSILLLASLMMSALVLLGLMARSRYYELMQERPSSN